jgi:hypothetical protein
LARVAAGLPAANAQFAVLVAPHRLRNAVIDAAAAWPEPSRRKTGWLPSGWVQLTGLTFPSRIIRPTRAGNRLA